MKTKLIALLTILFTAAAWSQDSAAQITRGMKSFGVRTGYVTLNKAPAAGLEFQYAFSSRFVFAPSIDYAFRNEGLDGTLINLDYHGPWQLGLSGKWYLYHIAGINYTTWSTHTTGENINDQDVTTRNHRMGLNFGAGLEYYARPSLKLSLQGKFNWVTHHNTGIFNIGISYVF